MHALGRGAVGCVGPAAEQGGQWSKDAGVGLCWSRCCVQLGRRAELGGCLRLVGGWNWHNRVAGGAGTAGEAATACSSVYGGCHR